MEGALSAAGAPRRGRRRSSNFEFMKNQREIILV